MKLPGRIESTSCEVESSACPSFSGLKKIPDFHDGLLTVAYCSCRVLNALY